MLSPERFEANISLCNPDLKAPNHGEIAGAISLVAIAKRPVANRRTLRAVSTADELHSQSRFAVPAAVDSHAPLKDTTSR
jgi:hypothetical protein